MSIPQHQCIKCKAFYPSTREYWHRDRMTLKTICKKCCAEYGWAYRNRDPEEYLKKQRERQSNRKDKRRAYDVANAERIAQKKREWRKANPDKVKKHKRDSQRRNSESHSIRNKRYRQRYPEKIREQSRVKWARRKTTEGKYTTEDIERLYEEQHGYCAYCGIRLFEEFHVDHVVPITRGGTNYYDNLLLACPHCNQSKNDKLVNEWAVVRGW